MSQFLQPSIIILKQGTDDSQGKAQLISNINACAAVVATIRTTLGPRGMDKLICEGNSMTISNDGATIMKMLDVVHPAAKTLVDIAKSQDEEVGDGTTSVVILAGELLKESKSFVEEGVHPRIIVRGFRAACELAKAKIKELAITLDSGSKDSAAEMRTVLERCAGTAINSKLIGSHNQFFSKMVVDAVMHLDEDLSLDLIGIKKVKGGSMEESLLVEGVAFKKCFSYAGFEQQPKKILKPKILLLNLELELKAEKDNAELKIESPSDYQAMVDAEWNIIYEKLDSIVKSGATVVFSRLAIGDLATQYFADRDLFCGGRVPQEDLVRVAKATGAQIQTTVSGLSAPVLGNCELFEERQVGGERFNFLTGCKEARTATIVLRGGGEQFIDEAERSLHDAIMIVRRARKHSAVVAGGGAIEMELSRFLRAHSRTIKGKQQLIINAYAKALEVIPRQISDNAGFDSTDILNQLRQKHAQGAVWYGVDIANEGITDTYKSFVWEPALVKLNSLTAATEAACLILSIDETVKNPKSSGASDDVPAPTPARRGGGRRR
jgi:T-complex protein 1 subunit eta